ncbi:MAG: alpha-2-macroglobulin family protein [Spirochaetales bacterium]|nr:alpha-2-macroglobulin family protein [Spirochaetales bacterium]
MKKNIFCLVLLTIILAGCTRITRLDLKNMTYSEELARVVSHVTSGIIPDDADIKVRFTEPVVPESAVGSAVDPGALTFTPYISGELDWEDTQTIRFRPEKLLPLRTGYTGRLDFTSIPTNTQELAPLKFAFITEGREINSFSGDFVAAKDDDPEYLQFRGNISFTLPVSIELVRNSVRLNKEFGDIPLNWTEGVAGKDYSFTSDVFERGSNKRKFFLKADAGGLELSEPFERVVYLEPARFFKLSRVNIIEQSHEPVIHARFTDALDQAQDLTGLLDVRPHLPLKIKVMGNDAYLIGNFERGRTYDIIVNPNIKSKYGHETEKQVTVGVTVPNLKPQISFSSDGVFLPSANRKKIRFQSINIKKVHLNIIRVFDNNLCQFIQTEQLSSTKDRNESFNSSYVNRVGVSVADQDLIIGDKENVWLQNELDLAKLIKKNDKGLYVISLSFSREDMIWNPSEASEDNNDDDDYYYYDDDYYSNPNSYGYIYAHGRIFKPVVLSDIGLTYIAADGQQRVYATNIISAERLKGVKVRLKSYQNQLIASAVTNTSGEALFKNVKTPVFYVEGEKGGQRSIVKLNEMGWNLSSFDIEGESVSDNGTRAFIFTERGVYRPGDPVNLSCILRNSKGSFPTAHPVTLNLYNPRNQVVKTMIEKEGVDGFYNFAFSTRQEDPTGNWKVEILAGSQAFIHPLKIETVVPDRLKVKIETQKPQLDYTDSLINYTITSSYLFGNPASGLDCSGDIKLVSRQKTFSKYSGYTFTDESVEFTPVSSHFKELVLDENGEVEGTFNLPDLSGVPSAVSAVITARVYERGGRSTAGRCEVPIDPYKYYVGLEVPEFEYGAFKLGSTMKLNAILLDLDGRPAPLRNLKYRLYRNSRYWWWEYDSRNEYRFRFKTDRSTELVKEGTIKSDNKPVTIPLVPDDNAEYLVEVEDSGAEGGHTAGFFFWASSWGKAAGKDPGALVLKTDKVSYSPGEKAKISFQRPDKGMVLACVEKNASVLSTEWFPLTGSKDIATITIPITKTMLPTAYVSVSIIQPHDQTVNDRPIRMYGIVPLNVVDRSTVQDIQIEMDDELSPNKPFRVRIRNRDKKRTQFTIAVVDEGLLSLTSFKTPDAWKHFYKKQRLDVAIYDLFSSVIGANKGDVFKVFSIGGDYDQEMFSGEEGQKAKRFEPVCLFQGPVLTNPEGYSDIEFDMPNYVGSVRVMVISAKGESYGRAEKTVPVKSELMALPTLPRVLGPDEKINIPVTVFSTKDSIKDVNVSITAEGPVKVEGKSVKTLRFDSIGDKDVDFGLITKPEVGAAKITIIAESGVYSSRSVTNIAVRATSPRIYASEEKIIEKGKKVILSIPDRGIPGTNKAVISVVKQPNLKLDHRYKWLIHYPYGCIEQTTSSVFPQLYLSEFMELRKKDEAGITDNINAGIQRLRKFQTESGGFSYWPGEKNPSIWGTNYAGHFLIEARARGYSLPAGMMEKWVTFQSNRANSGSDNLLERVYQVYLLALYGQPAVGPMNILKENHLKNMRNTEKWMLAAAYKLSGNISAAHQILRDAGMEVEEYSELGGTYGSQLRDKAMILDMVNFMNGWAAASDLFRELTDLMAKETWYSTQTIAYTLLAMGKYVIANSLTASGAKTIMTGTIVLPDGTSVAYSTDRIKYSLELSSGFGKNIEVILDNKSTLNYAYALLEWNGIPLKPDVTDLSNRITLTTEWLDENGYTIDPSYVKQGQFFYGHFKVSKKSDVKYQNLDELALVQILPSGWEIDNTRLSGEELPGWSSSLALNREQYLDIRDDRIMWFFDMNNYTYSLDFVVKLNAVTVGEFAFPPTLAEAMYDSTNYQAIKTYGKEGTGKTVVFK